MQKRIWKQTDSRWSSKPYPTYGSSFGGNGCGCCACTHIAMENPAYKKWTPEKLRPWMVKQGYAYVNQGTTWNGITATLKHVGYDNVVRVWDDPMSVAFKELKKGNRIGIFLFNDHLGGTKKIEWTGSGHYVAFTDTKYEGNDWWFYCKDSGGRDHDGWYSYKKHMQGAIAKVWIVERISTTTTKTKTAYTGEYPEPSIEHDVIEDAIDWGLDIAKDNTYIYKTWKSSDKNTKICSWCNPKLLKVAKYKGANCIGLAGAMLHHGAGVNVSCACNGLCSGKERYDTLTLAAWKKRNGTNWKQLTAPKRGCLIVCFDKNGKYKHIATSLGNGYILDGTSKHGLAKRKSSLGTYPKKKYFIYTGKSTKPARTYLQYGDNNDDVKKWQAYLVWYSDGAFKMGTGNFGENTLKWTKTFQANEMGTDKADGKVGADTIAKAKTIKK